MTRTRSPICFTQNEQSICNRLAPSLTRRNVEAMFPIDCFHGGDWRAHLAPQIDEACRWLADRPAERRAIDLGGWFADARMDQHDPSKGVDVGRFIADGLRAADITLRLVFADQEGRGSATVVADALTPFRAIAEKVCNFNNGDFPPGCESWWGQYTREHMDPRLDPCPEVYGANGTLRNYTNTIAACGSCVPVYPVCARDKDWKRRTPFAEAAEATRELIRVQLAHGHDTCLFATYMRATRSGRHENYFLRRAINLGDAPETLDVISDALEGM